MKKCSSEQEKKFCRAYLHTMDPQRAARAAGAADGYALLRHEGVRSRLSRMRACLSDQILREDAVRRLTELAFGRADDAFTLAIHPERAGDGTEEMDLSAVAELKVSDKGGVEIKFIDRIRALEALSALLESGDSSGAEAFFRALEDSADGGEEA